MDYVGKEQRKDRMVQWSRKYPGLEARNLNSGHNFSLMSNLGLVLPPFWTSAQCFEDKRWMQMTSSGPSSSASVQELFSTSGFYSRKRWAHRKNLDLSCPKWPKDLVSWLCSVCRLLLPSALSLPGFTDKWGVTRLWWSRLVEDAEEGRHNKW